MLVIEMPCNTLMNLYNWKDDTEKNIEPKVLGYMDS